MRLFLAIIKHLNDNIMVMVKLHRKLLLGLHFCESLFIDSIKITQKLSSKQCSIVKKQIRFTRHLDFNLRNFLVLLICLCEDFCANAFEGTHFLGLL